MKKETFTICFAILKQSFQSLAFNAEVWWELLKDLPDEAFKTTILRVCREMPEVYPGTNLIAIVRERTWQELKSQQNKTKKVPDLRCDPPPPEWEDLKQRLGI